MSKKKSLNTKNHTTKVQSTLENKRQRSKYPALNPAVNLRSRTHLLDFDYLHLLTPEELDYLNKFVEEEVHASFEKNNKKNLNRKIKDKRRCYKNNNKRNADVLVKQHAMKKIKYLDDIKNVTFNPEDQLNARIELKKLGVLDENGNKLRKKKIKIEV